MDVYIIRSSRGGINDKGYRTFEEAYEFLKNIVGGYNRIHNNFGGPIVGNLKKPEDIIKHQIASKLGADVAEIYMSGNPTDTLADFYIKKVTF